MVGRTWGELEAKCFWGFLVDERIDARFSGWGFDRWCRDYGMLQTVSAQRILHVSNRELIQKLRDDILRIHGFEVESTLSLNEALELAVSARYDLVLIDVEGEDRVGEAELLCNAIKKATPDQRVAYVCNHRVSSESDCPDEIIRAEFNPELLVRAVRAIMADS